MLAARNTSFYVIGTHRTWDQLLSWHLLISRPRVNRWWKELPMYCRQVYLWTQVSSSHRRHNSSVSRGNQVTRGRREASASCTEGAAGVHFISHDEHWQRPDPSTAAEEEFRLGKHSFTGESGQKPHLENPFAKNWFTPRVNLFAILLRTQSEARDGQVWMCRTPPLCPDHLQLWWSPRGPRSVSPGG